MEKIFKNIPAISSSAVLYRGISDITKEQFDIFYNSKIIDIPYYISATLSKKVAEIYSSWGRYRVLFEIEVPVGSKIVPLNYQLLEVLIDKNHKFLVKNTIKKYKNMYINCKLV